MTMTQSEMYGRLIAKASEDCEFRSRPVADTIQICSATLNCAARETDESRSSLA